MSEGAGLRERAEALAAPLPPLLAEAEHLAAAVMMGAHGRRRAGQGEEFWQYRAARPGDAARGIDWRRSGRSDAHFVREREWQAAQSVWLWVDEARSMAFASDPRLPAKSARARLLALATAVLLVRGGERVALASLDAPPRGSELQLLRIAEALTGPDEGAGEAPDYGAPQLRAVLPHSRALVMSDFLGETAPLVAQLGRAADRGVRGALVQVLDPAEEAFPFDGRTIFESMGGTLRHETLEAGELRERYRARLAARKAELAELARTLGWQYHCHHTSRSAQSALLWIYGALERRR